MGKAMTFEEKTLGSKRIYEGRIINLRVDDVTVVNGKSKREIVEHNGGAVIAALTEDKSLIMVRQYRKTTERVMLELPAGKIDKGEDPKNTAIRELKEETGFTADKIKLLTRMYPSVGYSEEILYIYLATGLSEGETDFDDNEAIDVEKYSVEKLYNMVMDGEIEDAKTQIGILMVKGILDSSEKTE